MIFTILIFILLGCLLLRYYNYNKCVVLQTINLGDCIVEIVDDKCKEGLPHTTGPHKIRMTRGTWEGPRRDDILIHERVHLSQKSAEKNAWLDFYQRSWGYTCISTPPSGIPDKLARRLRPNPDTSDCPWAIWHQRWVFFPAFNSDGSLRNAEVIVWDLEHNKIVELPDAWKSEFCGHNGCPRQYEHPHEISAEMLTSKKDDSPAAYKLYNWQK